MTALVIGKAATVSLALDLLFRWFQFGDLSLALSVLLMQFLDRMVGLFELCKCGGRAVCEELLVEGVEWSGYLGVSVDGMWLNT